jgi:hypothetical protein
MADRRRYAENTKVPVDQSRLEIERTLSRYGAEEFGYMVGPERAQIGFRMEGRMLRFTVPLPKDARNPEQETRRRWRALLLTIKAKLEAVASDIATFDEEFLAHIVIPGDGRTIGEAMVPELDRAYATRKMPALLGPVS